MNTYAIYIFFGIVSCFTIIFRKDLDITPAAAAFLPIVAVSPWLVWSFLKPNTASIRNNDQASENGEIKDLKIKIQAKKEGNNQFVVKITNVGQQTFTNVVVDIKKILFWADSFSLDTTHMPSDIQYCRGVECVAEAIKPNETVEMVITGYGTHDRYDRERIRYANISFSSPIKKKLHIPYWVEIVVDLPNARNGKEWRS